MATGAIVANLYYAQPLLHRIADTFHSGPGPTSWVITATQVGYAAGLLLIVPLGDLHPRRTLVVRLFCIAAVALVASRPRARACGSSPWPRWPWAPRRWPAR